MLTLVETHFSPRVERVEPHIVTG